MLSADDESLAVWKALADPSRRRMLDMLREKPRTTGELAAAFSFTRFATMKHLELLVAAHLVFVERHGRERWNHLNPVPLQEIVERWLHPFEAASVTALTRLKRAAEAAQPGGTTVSASESSPVSSYEVRLEIRIRAPRERVWKTLVEEIGRWWPATFYTHPSPTNFVIENHVGGRVFEDWGNGEGGLWGTVVVFKANERLQIAGEIFPEYGGVGRYHATYLLVDDGADTLVKFHDAGVGALKGGNAASLEEGWRELLGGHWKNYAETGAQPTRPASVSP